MTNWSQRLEFLAIWAAVGLAAALLALAIVAMGLAVVFALGLFAIWWPTMFGIEGAWRAALAAATLLPAIYWIVELEIGPLAEEITDFCIRLLAPLSRRLEQLRN